MICAEDRALLAEHGVPINPEGLLTPQLEIELRKLRRKIKNKMSAKDSRKRRKAYLCDLEEKSTDLQGHVTALQNENRALLAKLHQLQALHARQAGSAAAAAVTSSATQVAPMPHASAASHLVSHLQQASQPQHTSDSAPRACMLMMMLLVFSAANQNNALDGQ